MPEDQEVVVVEDGAGRLAIDVAGEEQTEVVGVFRAPREGAAQSLLEGTARVHTVAVDVEAGGFLRKAPVGACEAESRPHRSHEVLAVGAVKDREARVEPDVPAVKSQQPRGRGVEGAAPHTSACLGAQGARAGGAGSGWQAQRGVCAAEHLGRRPPCEREEEDAGRVHPPGDVVGHAVGERRGLTRAGPRDDEQRPFAVEHGLTLAVVELRPGLGTATGALGGCLRAESARRQAGGFPGSFHRCPSRSRALGLDQVHQLSFFGSF